MARRQFTPIQNISELDIERFWKRVDKRGPDECWPWIRKSSHSNHATIKISGYGYAARRIAFFLSTSIDPLDLDVCHSCDNPPCQNPNHLFIGTTLDNMADMVRKGRQPNVRLTWEIIDSIRSRYPEEGSLLLSREFGIAQGHVVKIIKGLIWREEYRIATPGTPPI